METVFTVALLRCHQCQRLIAPHEPWFRQQVKTAVEVGARVGMIARYELVTLCEQCNEGEVALAVEEQNREWWRNFWIAAILVNIGMVSFLPVGILPLYGALLVRGVYKWQSKRQPVGVSRTRRAL